MTSAEQLEIIFRAAQAGYFKEAVQDIQSTKGFATKAQIYRILDQCLELLGEPLRSPAEIFYTAYCRSKSNASEKQTIHLVRNSWSVHRLNIAWNRPYSGGAKKDE